MANPSFLAHKDGDDVAVAVRDVARGEALVGYLDTDPEIEVEVATRSRSATSSRSRDVAAGRRRIEYGVRIGSATAGHQPGATTSTPTT